MRRKGQPRGGLGRGFQAKARASCKGPKVATSFTCAQGGTKPSMAKSMWTRKRLVGDKVKEVGRGQLKQSLVRSLDFILSIWEAVRRCS